MPEDRPDGEACEFVAGEAARETWSSVQAEAWIGLLETHKRLTRALEAELEAEHGLSLSSVELLGRLAAADSGRLRLSALAVQASLSLSRVSRLVDGLEARRLVRREACPSDARAVDRISPTPVYLGLGRPGHPRRLGADPLLRSPRAG